MPWSYAHIDWNGTGAMVQAVGSVAAILVAVWVERGTARRQERQRLAELEDAVRARLDTLQLAKIALLGLSRTVRDSFGTGGVIGSVPAPIWRAIVSARATLQHYLAAPSGVAPQVIAALAEAELLLGWFVDEDANRHFPLADDGDKQHLLTLVDDLVDAIGYLQEHRSSSAFRQLSLSAQC